MEPDGSAQVAVFVDFENLVLGAVKELPDLANPAPYEALTRQCRDYGNASVRRADAACAGRDYGGGSVRALLGMPPERSDSWQAGGPDVTGKLIEEPRKAEPQK